jgi:hypothetical protein
MGEASVEACSSWEVVESVFERIGCNSSISCKLFYQTKTGCWT